jgi:hypothetical protein
VNTCRWHATLPHLLTFTAPSPVPRRDGRSRKSRPADQG